LAAAGRRLVENNYSWTAIAERCISSYTTYL
jgi:hypothetical protein